jgi:hypothetical protein
MLDPVSAPSARAAVRRGARRRAEERTGGHPFWLAPRGLMTRPKDSPTGRIASPAALVEGRRGPTPQEFQAARCRCLFV